MLKISLTLETSVFRLVTTFVRSWRASSLFSIILLDLWSGRNLNQTTEADRQRIATTHNKRQLAIKDIKLRNKLLKKN